MLEPWPHSVKVDQCKTCTDADRVYLEKRISDGWYACPHRISRPVDNPTRDEAVQALREVLDVLDECDGRHATLDQIRGIIHRYLK